MAHKVLRKGKWKTREDTDYEIGDIINHKKMGLTTQILFYQLIGYDKCPYCKSKHTFHKRAVKIDPRIQNCEAIQLQQGRMMAFLKFDKCIKCKRTFLAQVFVHEIRGKLNFIKKVMNKWFKEVKTHGKHK